jgi:hypothetical protein
VLPGPPSLSGWDRNPVAACSSAPTTQGLLPRLGCPIFSSDRFAQRPNWLTYSVILLIRNTHDIVRTRLSVSRHIVEDGYSFRSFAKDSGNGVAGAATDS